MRDFRSVLKIYRAKAMFSKEYIHRKARACEINYIPHAGKKLDMDLIRSTGDRKAMQCGKSISTKRDWVAQPLHSKC